MASFDNESVLRDLIFRKEEELKDLKLKLKNLQNKRIEKDNVKRYEDIKKRNICIFEKYINAVKEWCKDENAIYKMEDSDTKANIIEVSPDDDDEDIDEWMERIQNVSEFKEGECSSIPKFGDIIDFTGYRHYGMKFVGKEGKLIKTSLKYGYGDDIEAGLQVPWEICMYLNNPLEKYKYLDFVVSFELCYNNLIVQAYKAVTLDKCYIYLHDFDYDEWQLISYDVNGNETVLSKDNRHVEDISLDR